MWDPRLFDYLASKSCCNGVWRDGDDGFVIFLDCVRGSDFNLFDYLYACSLRTCNSPGVGSVCIISHGRGRVDNFRHKYK